MFVDCNTCTLRARSDTLTMTATGMQGGGAHDFRDECVEGDGMHAGRRGSAFALEQDIARVAYRSQHVRMATLQSAACPHNPDSIIP